MENTNPDESGWTGRNDFTEFVPGINYYFSHNNHYIENVYSNLQDNSNCFGNGTFT